MSETRLDAVNSLKDQGMRCPNGCGPLEPYAEVDVGVGVIQGGPWGCPVCHWTEADDPEVKKTLAEMEKPFPDDMEEWP